MTMDAIAAVAMGEISTGTGVPAIAVNTAGLAPAGATEAAPAAAPFADLFTGAVDQVNALEDAARNAVTGLMTGSGVDVHQAMIATEKANMAFELSLAVRNKAVGAYQQVMSMQF